MNIFDLLYALVCISDVVSKKLYLYHNLLRFDLWSVRIHSAGTVNCTAC